MSFSIPPPPKSLPPSTVGPYVVRASLAAGGLGRVLLAHPIGKPSAPIALKRAHPHLVENEEVRAMWRSEARWTKAIRHPNVVAGLELVEGDGELALAMEYVHGPSLALLLDVAARAKERPAIAIVLRVMLDVLAALAAVHAAPVAEGGRLVHGDVNPRNVLVGDDGVTKLCDFGLACPEAPYEDRGVFRGTAAYCAPETIERGERTTRSDVFAAGVVLWEALRLERLFRGEGYADSMRRVAVVAAPPLDRNRPELAALAEVARDMLVKDAKDRAPSAELCAERIARAHPIAPRTDVAALVRAAAAGELARRREALANDF